MTRNGVPSRANHEISYVIALNDEFILLDKYKSLMKFSSILIIFLGIILLLHLEIMAIYNWKQTYSSCDVDYLSTMSRIMVNATLIPRSTTKTNIMVRIIFSCK